MHRIHKALAVHLTVISLFFTGLIPLAPSTAFAQDSCSYPNDQRLAEAQRECTKNPAKTWRCDLNRCINTGEAQNMREEFKKCAEMVDDASRKQCHDDFAKSESGLENKEKGPNSFLAGAAATINGANALMMVLSGAGKSPGGECISRKIYMAASIVSVLAELYLQFMAKDKLKELQDKYGKEQVEEEAHAAQVRALQYLKEEQETIAKMAKTRATAYTIQMALYGATTVMALLEMTAGMTWGTPTPCLTPEQQEKHENEQEAKELKAENEQIKADQEAMGERPTEAGADQDAYDAKKADLDTKLEANNTATAENAQQKTMIDNKKTNTETKNKNAKEADKKLSDDDKLAKDDPNKMSEADRASQQAIADMGTGFALGKALATSTGIFFVAGVSTGIAVYLKKAATEQEKEATDNAGKVQTLIDKFNGVMASSGYCSPAQRSDLSNPQCYCYEASGDKNMNRSNSQACQALWAQNGQNLMVGASNYNGKLDPKLRVCMLLNGQVDRACKCRQMINKTSGENACMKVPMGSNQMGNIGTSLGIPALSSTVGNLASGNTSFGSLNADAIAKQAQKNREIADKMIAENNTKRAAEGLPPIDPFSPVLAARMMKKLTNKDLSAAAASSLGNLAMGGRPTKGALANAIKSADANSGLSKKSFYSGGKSLGRSGGGSSKGDDFAFMNTEGSGGAGNVASYMDKNYDYKSNDIVKNKGVSIWKVISARYTKSGLRRLFEEEGDKN